MYNIFFKNTLFLTTTFLVLLNLQCSDPFDASTSLGKSIINEAASSLLESRSVAFADSLAVISDTSYIHSGNNLKGVAHYPYKGKVAMGQWNGLYAIPYMEFLFNKGDFIEFYKRVSDSIKTLRIQFTITDVTTAFPSQACTFYFSLNRKPRGAALNNTSYPFIEFLQASAHILKQDTIKKISSPDKSSDSIPIMQYLVEFVFYDASRIIDKLIEKMNQRFEQDSVLGIYVPTDSIFPLFRIEVQNSSLAPKFIINYQKKGADSTRSFPISWADYSVFDRRTINFDPLPLSSMASGRYAIFQLDMSSFWDSISVLSSDKSYRVIGYSVLHLSPKTVTIEESDSHYVNIVYGIGLEPAPDIKQCDSLRVKTISNSQIEISLPVRRFLQQFISAEPSKVYLWLGLGGEEKWSEIMWKPQLYIKTYAFAP